MRQFYPVSMFAIGFISLLVGFFALKNVEKQIDQSALALELAQQQTQLAMEPQLDVYLKHGEGEILLGIRNIGRSTISNLNIQSSISEIRSTECLKDSFTGGVGISGDQPFGRITRLEPGEGHDSNSRGD